MRHVYRLEGLGCASCADKMEVAIKKINGVKSVSIVFLTQRMTLEADDSAMRRIEQEVEKAIKKIESDVKMKRISK